MNFKKYHVSRNLLDWATVQDNCGINASGNVVSQNGRIATVTPINVENIDSVFVSWTSDDTSIRYIYAIFSNGVLVERVDNRYVNTTVDVSAADSMYVCFYSATDITKNDITNVMINSGTTRQPYEPYFSEVWHDISHYIHKTSTDTLATLPAVLYPNDTTATVGLKGNTTQSGTPTPDNPIMPQGTGEMTGNLFDYSAITIGYRIQWTNGAAYADDTAIMSDYIPVTEGDYTLNISSIIIGYAADKSYIGVYRSEETWEKLPSDPILSFTVLSNTNVEFVRLLTYGIYSPITDALMLNTGSTPLPYEPYGYKIPISSNSITTPVYLGEVETTRKIGKIDLSEVSWTMLASGLWRTLDIPNIKYVSANTELGGGIAEKYTIHTSAGMISALNCIAIDVSQVSVNTGSSTETPTGMFWYVLATDETGMVNEPLMKIGDYADTLNNISIPVTTGANTLSVDTTIQPSEVTVNYHGWHTGAVHERENSQWD